MHGSAAMEIALLCQGAGVKMYTPIYGSRLVRTLVSIGDRQSLGSLGVTLLRDPEIEDLLSSGEIDALLLSTPEQVLQVREHLDPIRKLPFIIRHGLNSFDKFKLIETKNFLSPSPRGLALMSECNCFLMRKLIPWQVFPKSDTYGWQRRGFHSYIHHFKKKWPDAKNRFDRLRSMLDDTMTLECYGREGDRGIANDLEMMKRSRGTVHIKDGQVVCNAVIRSLAVGTPVLMDRTTYERCFFDAIEGIILEDTLEGLRDRMKELTDDEALDEACEDAFATAKRQFVYSHDLGDEFVHFLGKLRV